MSDETTSIFIDNPSDSMVASMESDESLELGESNTMPSYGSDEWDDFVMSKFKKGEVFSMPNGKPTVTCAGLRRVAEELLGDIVVSRPSQVFPAMDTDGPGRATVVFEVTIDWFNSGRMRTFSDVADVWHGNTDDLFCAHPVATASTRAEGRALRKALRIKCLAAEELAKKDVASIVRMSVETAKKSQISEEGDWSVDSKISDTQVNFIDKKCQQVDIDVRAFLNMGKEPIEDISKVSKQKALKMIEHLNTIQSGKSDKTGLGNYNPNWRQR
tara:strand:- start:1112 stop:1927 length:816 start_codon:yes stop_codon:yes gene_type:complete